MATAHKLWLGFGTLIGMMVAIVLILFLWLGILAERAENLAMAVGPANRAAHTMEIKVNAIGAGVLDHMHAPSDAHRERIANDIADFEESLTTYQRMANSKREDELGQQAAALFQQYESLSLFLLERANAEPAQEDLAALMDLRLEIDGVLDEAQTLTMNRLTPARERIESSIYALQTATLALLGAGVVVAGIAGTVVGRTVVATERDLRRSHETLERRVGERTRELGELNEALMHSNRELEQFASVASHDLQEPLRKIQAFGDRLQARYGDKLEQQGRQYVERMQSAATRMRKLIDDLLSFSRVTTKAQPFAPVDLAEVVEEVLGDLESRVADTGGRVEVGDLPTIDADALQIRLLLQNLIANGLKFHKADQAPVVRVEAELNGTERPTCVLRISDNGIGFDETYLDRIFEVFQRLHGRQEYEGTGMGLAICRKIVYRHGGHITAHSAPEQGATFVVELPVCQIEPESEEDD